MKADTKSSPGKQIHCNSCNTSTVDTLSGNALTCLMMKPVQSAQGLKAAGSRRWTPWSSIKLQMLQQTDDTFHHK